MKLTTREVLAAFAVGLCGVLVAIDYGSIIVVCVAKYLVSP